MRKIYILILIAFISVNIFILNEVLAEEINPLSDDSPIKETFDKKIIVWRFDDIRITMSDSSINNWLSMSRSITMHGGYVGWGFIPGSVAGMEAPPPQNLTYPQERVHKFNEVTSDERISLWLHDWNHSWYTGKNGPSVWKKSIEQQREALNYTVWTFYNNFGYYPPIFSAGGSAGNVNTTVVLAERDILLLCGNSNYEPLDERLRYLTLPSSKDSVLIALDYQNRENILDDMKDSFTIKYNNSNIHILQIMLHPQGWNQTTIPIFAEFTEWVYTNHDLVNMNYTDAYNYKHDIECIQLDKQNNQTYRLNFQEAFKALEITWSEPGNWIVEYAYNQTRYGDLKVTSLSDSIILEPGHTYTIRSSSAPFNTNNDLNKDQEIQIPFTNIAIIFLIISLIIYVLFKFATKRK